MIPRVKADAVVTTLTWYKPEPDSDRALLELLTRCYRQVYFWTQQSEDRNYFESIAVPGVRYVSPSVRNFDRLLEEESVDYIGLRLHGGIRALQKRRRALILPVDNRAVEIGRDTRLPTQKRDELASIERWIWDGGPTSVKLPIEAIERWKGQFR
jgi:hypothetical protein